MKKTLILIIVLLLLGVFLWVYSGQSNSTIDTTDREFKVENVDDIHKILIVPRNLPPTTLTKKNGTWYFRDSLMVQANVMKNLMDVFENIHLKFIPTSAAVVNIKREMMQIGIKVNLYDRSDGLMKSFYIGGSPPDERGTHMMMDGAQQPYTMHMPHMEGSVRGRFLVKPNEWQDRTLFKENPSEVTHISVEYPKDMKHSFQLKKENGEFSLSTLSNSPVQRTEQPDKDRLRAYIEGFDEIISEYIENDHPKRDSLTAQIPFSIISYSTATKENNTMTLFPVTHNLADDANTTELKSSDLVERYFVECSWGPFMLVQQRQLKRLLRGYEYFIIE